MTILLVATAQIVAAALCAVAVRAQLALFRGFDVMIAAVVTIASEITCALGIWFPNLGWYGAAAALAVSACGAAGFMVIWNRFVDGWMGDSARRGTALLVISLFCATAISGIVGLARGPGLVGAPWPDTALRLGDGSSLYLGTLFACVAGIALIAGLIAWPMSRVGFALELWAQDRSFAREIGISERNLVAATGIAAALAASTVGVWSGLSNGSTPDVGLGYFLTGAGGALLFSGPRLVSAAVGGAVIGTGVFGLQLWLSPAQTNMLLFLAIGAFLVARGADRLEQGVR